MPNALIMAVAGVALVLILGDMFGLVFLLLALVALVVGAFIPAISGHRLQEFASKHGATTF